MRVVTLSAVEGIPIPGQDGLVWKPLRHELGVGAFGVSAFTANRAGDQVVEEHDETGGGAGHHEELYVVVTGHATFAVDGREIDAPAGTLVFVAEPAQRRGAVAREAGTTLLVVGGARGEAFRVSPWEHSFRAYDAASKGDRGAARAIVNQGLELHPGNAGLLYDLACFEALEGEAGPALTHLREALERDPGLHGRADIDPDLDAIRNDPRFPKDGDA